MDSAVDGAIGGITGVPGEKTSEDPKVPYQHFLANFKELRSAMCTMQLFLVSLLRHNLASQ